MALEPMYTIIAAPMRFQIISYKNVGWNSVPLRACGSVIALFAMPDGGAFHVEFQTPWKRCRSAIQFLVEPVAQTPNSLRYQQARSDGVSQQGHWIVLMTAPCPCGQRSEQHAAPDAKSAIPNAEHFHQSPSGPEETFRRGDDVIKSCADNARRHADQSDIKHLVEIATQLFPTCGGYPYCKDDSHQNAQRIDMNHYWTDGKLRNRWRWNVCKCHEFPDGSPRIRYGVAWTTEIVGMVYFTERAL